MGKELTISQLTFVDLYDSYTLSLSSDVIAVPCNSDGEALSTKTYTIDYQVRAGESVITSVCESATLSTSINNVTINTSTLGKISVTVKTTAKIPEDSGINIKIKTGDGTDFTFERFVSFMNIKSGKDGRSVESVTEYYAATSTNNKPSGGWQTSIPSYYGPDYPYLWNYSSVNYSEGSPDPSDAQIIAYWGQDGGTGRGIDRIEEWYATNDNPNVAPVSGWTTTLKVPTSDERYLWNYEIIYYSDNTYEPTDKRVIGVHGEDGASAFSFKVVTDKGSVFTDGIEEIKLSLEAYQGEDKTNEVVPYEWSYYDSKKAEWVSLSGPQEMSGSNTVAVSEVSKTSNINGLTQDMSSGYYTINMTDSQGKEVHSSYSLIKLTYTITRTTNLIVRCISYGETNWDYMMVSKISTNENTYKLSENSDVDSSSQLQFSCKESSSQDPIDVTFNNVTPGTYYVYVKVRKDGSVTKNDIFKFKCLENSTSDFIENISLTVKNADPYAYSMFKCQIIYKDSVYSDYETLQKDAHDVYYAETKILDDGLDGNSVVLYTELTKNGKVIDKLLTNHVEFVSNLKVSDNSDSTGYFYSDDLGRNIVPGNHQAGDFVYLVAYRSIFYLQAIDDRDEGEFVYADGMMYDSKGDATGIPYKVGTLSGAYHLVLARYDGTYWRPYNSYDAYEYCYINDPVGNVLNFTFGNAKVFVVDKRYLTQSQSLNVEIHTKTYDENKTFQYYVSYMGFANDSSVYDIWKIYNYYIGEDTRVFSFSSTTFQSIKMSYAEEHFRYDSTGVYVAHRITEFDQTGELTQKEPFYVKINSEKMSFFSREYGDDNRQKGEDVEMVYIGNNSTSIRNAVLEENTTVNGVTTFNNNIFISNPEMTNGFLIQTESDGSMSLVLA